MQVEDGEWEEDGKDEEGVQRTGQARVDVVVSLQVACSEEGTGVWSELGKIAERERGTRGRTEVGLGGEAEREVVRRI